jgi:hypothetical protein
MRRPDRPSESNEFIDALKAKQDNLLWPSSLVNSRRVDEFFFKGRPNPTPVQRVAAWLFGLADISIGFGFVAIARHAEQNGWVGWILAAGMWALGALTCYNGSRKSKNKKSHHDASASRTAF